MIVCDASALIGWLDSADALHERAVAALDRAAAEELAAPTVTIAEVLVGPTRAGLEERALSALADLGLVEIPLEGAAARLAELRVATGRRLPDCCVLCAAQLTGGAVLSFDRKLASAARSLQLKASD